MSTDKDSFDIVSTDSLLPDQIKQVTLEQRGSYNTQIAQAHIENVDRSTNFFIGQPSANQQMRYVTPPFQWIALTITYL